MYSFTGFTKHDAVYKYIAQVSQTHESLTSALMNKVNKTCTRLSSLSITMADMTAVKCTDMAPALAELRLVRCEVPVKWFLGSSFTHLDRLYLDYSPRIDYTHIRDLASTSTVKTLTVVSLRGCYRVDDRAVEALTSFSLLNDIDLDETNITNYGLEIALTKFVRPLARLSVCRCKIIRMDTRTIEFVQASLLRQPFKFIYQ